MEHKNIFKEFVYKLEVDSNKEYQGKNKYKLFQIYIDLLQKSLEFYKTDLSTFTHWRVFSFIVAHLIKKAALSQMANFLNNLKKDKIKGTINSKIKKYEDELITILRSCRVSDDLFKISVKDINTNFENIKHRNIDLFDESKLKEPEPEFLNIIMVRSYCSWIDLLSAMFEFSYLLKKETGLSAMIQKCFTDKELTNCDIREIKERMDKRYQSIDSLIKNIKNEPYNKVPIYYFQKAKFEVVLANLNEENKSSILSAEQNIELAKEELEMREGELRDQYFPWIAELESVLNKIKKGETQVFVSFILNPENVEYNAYHDLINCLGKSFSDFFGEKEENRLLKINPDTGDVIVKTAVEKFVKYCSETKDILDFSYLNAEDLMVILNNLKNNEKFVLEYINPGPNIKDNKIKIYVLRDWNSFTPAIPREPGKESRGGGYLIQYNEKYIAVDPGFDYVNNLMAAGLSVTDITDIIITHEHSDHLNNLDIIKNLWFEYCKRNDLVHNDFISKKKIYINSTLELKMKSSKNNSNNPIVVNPNKFETFRLSSNISFQPTPCKHKELDGNEKNTFGLILEFKKENFKIGITSDTGWYEKEDQLKSLGEHFKPVDILLLHIGTLRTEDFISLNHYRQHLGFLGVTNLLQDYFNGYEPAIKPKLAIISEFGEEFRGIRKTVSEMIAKFIYNKMYDSSLEESANKDYQNLPIIPSDRNLCIIVKGNDRNKIVGMCNKIDCYQFSKNCKYKKEIANISLKNIVENDKLYYLCKEFVL